MKKILLIICLSSPFFSTGQKDSIPIPDIYSTQRLVEDFTKYNPNYAKQKDEAVTRTKLLAKKVFDLEKAGVQTSCMHQVLFETESLLVSSANFIIVNQRLDELDSLINNSNKNVHQNNSLKNAGECYHEWYLKVYAAYDELEKEATEEDTTYKPLPYFLDTVNTPEKLQHYLTSVSVSDVSKTGIDNEREYNEMLATLIQMIIRGRPQNYIVDSTLRQSLKNIVLKQLRNNYTGWWGESYIRNGHVEFVDDLSITFHVISYLKGKVPDMNKVITTVLAVKKLPYPTGWLWNNQYWNHNNMDIVTLFQLGWQQANEQQRNDMRREIDSMLNWCLANSLNKDGSFKIITADGSVEDAEYYGVSFLSRIGYFDATKRFWTTKDFPEAAGVRNKIINFIKLHQNSGGTGGDSYKSALEDLNYKE